MRKMKDKTSSVKCLLEEFFSKLGREGGTHWCFLKWGNYLVNKKDDCVRQV